MPGHSAFPKMHLFGLFKKFETITNLQKSRKYSTEASLGSNHWRANFKPDVQSSPISYCALQTRIFDMTMT